MAKNTTTKYVVMFASVVLVILLLMWASRRGFEGFQGGDASFTLYYADWCPHCKTVKPVFADWSKAGSVQINGKSVTTKMVEESQNTDKSVPVKGYPTFLLKKSDGSYVEFSGDRSPSGWESWLAQNL